jgi:hypothetical protein
MCRALVGFFVGIEYKIFTGPDSETIWYPALGGIIQFVGYIDSSNIDRQGAGVV